MFKERRNRLLFLSNCIGLARKTLLYMVREDPTLTTVFLQTSIQISKRYGLSLQMAEKIKDRGYQKEMLQRLDSYSKRNIFIITIFDQAYPALLKEIYDPPLVLYITGDARLLACSKVISVVGTRDPSKNGLESLEKIITPLIQQNWVIVSGLAYGIDVASHKLALLNNGSTIAVLGSGFDHIYPKEHATIATEIAKKDLLISEYPPEQKPAKWHFPLRNRIISGLSRGALIIEARVKSRSLITGDQSLQQGREVFAVPGSIMEPRTAGTHRLIQEGAKLTTCAEDIIEELTNF